MRRAKLIGFFILLAASFSAYAEVKSLDDVMAKATSEETQDLGKLLKQIDMIPAAKTKDSQQLMKVTRVEKGSLWDRNGIKVGDFVASGHSRPPGQKVELKKSTGK